MSKKIYMEIYYLILKLLKRVYLFFFPIKQTPLIFNAEDAQIVSNKIYSLLVSNKPCMIARFGATESNVLKNYISINSKQRSILDFITNKCAPWWWNKNILMNFKLWSGFFPIDTLLVEKYCKLTLSDIPEVNMLGTWMADENLCNDELRNALKVNFE